jgi:hypothetical protein
LAAYKRTGKFPDGTTLVKELVSVGSKQATSGRGYFMGEFIGLEVARKDAKRFKDEPGNWAYFSFGHEYPLADTAKAFPSQSCNACHANSAADDFVFTQYYPVLRAAKGGVVRPADAGHTLHDGTTCEECKAGIRRFAMAAGTARKPSADTPSGSLGAVPTGNEDLHKYLVAGKYKNFAAAESETHPSGGPHTRFGSPVKVYMNAMMSDAFKTGKKTLPKGAASVKEMFSKEGQLEGWAVMLKTKDDSDGGDGWFWYETTNISDANDVVARGNGVAMCYGCHSSGSDFVLTGYPLK